MPSPLLSNFIPTTPSPQFSLRRISARILLSNAASAALPLPSLLLFNLTSSIHPSKLHTMLSSLPSFLVVSHLSAGPFLHLRSTSSSQLAFTNLLHSWYESKEKLLEYSNDPAHVNLKANMNSQLKDSFVTCFCQVEKFYRLCDPEKENLCLYGLPNETWEVNLLAKEVPPELPEPV